MEAETCPVAGRTHLLGQSTTEVASTSGASTEQSRTVTTPFRGGHEGDQPSNKPTAFWWGFAMTAAGGVRP